MKKLFSLMLVAVVAAGAMLFASFGMGNDTTTSKGEAWVDLGLPSGLLWAMCNLGASSPEEYGDYYAWGETTTKSAYDWSTYRYGTVDDEGYLNTLTKYNTATYYGTVSNLTTLLPRRRCSHAGVGQRCTHTHQRRMVGTYSQYHHRVVDHKKLF